MFMRDIVHLGELPRRLVIQPGVVGLAAIYLFRTAFAGRCFFLTAGLIPFSITVLYAAVSIFVSWNSYTATSAFMAVVACFSAVFIVSNLSLNGMNHVWFLSAILFAALITAVVGILQVWTGFDYYPSLAFPGSTYMNRNYAAHVCAVAVPVGAGLFLINCKQIWLNAFALLSCSISWLYIQYAGTRSAWLASFAACLFLFILTLACRGKGRVRIYPVRRWVGVLAVLFITTLLSWYSPTNGSFETGGAFFNRANLFVEQLKESISGAYDPNDKSKELEKSVSDAGVDQSALGRLHSLKASGRMLGDYWLMGTGAGQFEVKYPPYDADGFETRFAGNKTILRFLHNDHIQFVIEYGILPTAICIFFALYIFYKMPKNIREDKTISVAYAGALALLLIAAVDGPFVKPTTQLIFGTLIGLILSVDEKFGMFFLPRRFKYQRVCVCLIGILLCSVSIVGLRYYHRRVLAEKEYHQMSGYWQNGYPQKAIKYGRAAVMHIEDFHKLGVAYGDLLSVTGNYMESKAQFEKVLTANPFDYTSHLKLAAINQHFGDLDAAIEHYDVCLKLVPSDNRVMLQCAQIFQAREDFLGASRYLSQFIEANPKEATGYLMLAYNFEQLREIENALLVVKRGLVELPENQYLTEKLEALSKASRLGSKADTD